MAGIRRRIWIAATFLALTMRAVAEEPVPLSLPEAVKMTLANNPMHKAALADTKATLAGVSEARAPMLPRIMFAAQVQRSARQQELIERRNQSALAKTRLALAMGAAADAQWESESKA